MTESIQRLSPDQSNEQSLQNALNACRGVGGTVVVTPGEWNTGPLDIPSNTTLRINEGAVIRFLDDPSLYPPVPTRWEGVDCYGYHPLIVVADAELVRIEGRGIFDGSGARWWSTYRGIREERIKPEQVPGVNRIKELNIGKSRASGGGGRETGFLRPSILQIRESSQVVVDGPTFRDSPFWTSHVLYSSDVTIRNCRFENPADSPNTDGLNIDSSESVQVSGCDFNVGDDCLCLKSGSDEDGRRVGRPVRNVGIRDCRMNRGHGGIVFGSEISGGIEDIRIENCEMNRTDRGIRIKARRGRGGYVRRINISKLKLNDVPYPLVVNAYYRCGITEDERPAASDPDERTVDAGTPSIEQITVSDLTADGILLGAFIQGLPELPVRQVRLDRWRLSTDPAIDPAKPRIPAMDFADTAVETTHLHVRHTRDLTIEGWSIDDRPVS